MADVVVKLKPALPKGQWNGLAPIADELSQNRETNVVAVVILGHAALHTHFGGNETVDMQIMRIEAVTDPEQASVLRGFMRRIHEDRLAIRALPGMRQGDDLSRLGRDIEPEEDATD
jgi:hypothetical protein